MTVADNYIRDIATNGVYFKRGATDAVVQRNVIERVGEGGILVGFDISPEFFDLTENPGYFEAIRGIVRNNLIRDSGRAGLSLYASRDAIIANNTLLRTATSARRRSTLASLCRISTPSPAARAASIRAS